MTAAKSPPPYHKSVFINCPFDDKFKPKFWAMAFAVQACGFTPRCALEENNADAVRIQKIIQIISECQYGIHDVSLEEIRFNMPLELGLFIGCKEYGVEAHREKRYIIFEGEAFSSKRYLSDLSGQDPMAHQNKTPNVVGCVVRWLTDKADDPTSIPGATHIIKQHKKFRDALPTMCRAQNRMIKDLSFTQYSSLVGTWLRTSRHI